MANTTLKEAVAAAADKIISEQTSGEKDDTKGTEPDTDDSESGKSETDSGKKSAEKGEETDTDEQVDQEEDRDTRFALDLAASLRDPKTAYATLRTLAENMGVEITQKTETKTTAKKTAKQVIQEALGDEYPVLAERLGNVFETLLDRAVSEKTSVLERKILENEAAQVNNEIKRELKALSTRTKGASQKFEKELVTWMGKYQPAQGSNLTIEEFLDDAWSSVSRDTKVAADIKKRNEKINRNENEESSSSSGESNEERVKAGPQRVTIKEAVRLASLGKRVGEK